MTKKAFRDTFFYYGIYAKICGEWFKVDMIDLEDNCIKADSRLYYYSDIEEFGSPPA